MTFYSNLHTKSFSNLKFVSKSLVIEIIEREKDRVEFWELIPSATCEHETILQLHTNGRSLAA